MIKNMVKLTTTCLLTALLFLPLGTAQARGLDDGPFFGESVLLKSGETFQGDLVIFGGSVTIESDATVNGSVILIGGSLVADGDVRGDMVVVGGAVSLSSNAHIFGNLFTVGAPISRAEGARIDGSVLNNPRKPAAAAPEVVVTPALSRPGSIFDGAMNFVGKVFSLFFESIGFGLLAALLILFLPQQARRVGEAIPAQPAWAGALGLGSILLFVTAIVALGLFSVLIVTMFLTIPLIIGITVIFAAAMVFGWVGLGNEIGLRLGTALKTEFPLPLSAGLGTFLLYLGSGVFGLIPCVGWVVPTLLSLVSLGAVFLTRFGTRPLLTMTETPIEPVLPAQTE
ncbi:MAG: hypothetical protein Fur0016_11110 [Anaerolineales bacterium]